MKLSEAIRLFERVNRSVLRETTQDVYKAGLQDFSAWYLEAYGDLPLEEVKRKHIRAYRDQLLTRRRRGPSRKHPSTVQTDEDRRRRRRGQLSLWTVNRQMRTVFRLFNWLEEEGELTAVTNPVNGVKNIPVNQMAMQSIEVEALLAMIEHAKRPAPLLVYDARDRAIVALMGIDGVGAGELSRLRLADIDADEQALRVVSRTFDHQPEERERRLVMTSDQAARLAQWLALRPSADHDYVFTALDRRGGDGGGGAMGVKAIYSAFRKVIDMTPEARQTRQEAIDNERRYVARRLALLLFFLDTGARMGGVLGLTRDRLDLGARRAVVVEKGGKVRTVFFSPETAAAVAAWLELGGPSTAEHVFPVKPFRLRQMFAKLADQAGVQAPANPHAYRHTFAKMAIQNGADLSQVQRFMGHSSVKVTSDFYAHWNVRELQRIHDIVSPVANLSKDEEE